MSKSDSHRRHYSCSSSAFNARAYSCLSPGNSRDGCGDSGVDQTREGFACVADLSFPNRTPLNYSTDGNRHRN